MAHVLFIFGVVILFFACGGKVLLPKLMPNNENSSCLGCGLGAVFGGIFCVAFTIWWIWIWSK